MRLQNNFPPLDKESRCLLIFGTTDATTTIRPEMLGDPRCGECFEKELFAEPFPDVPDDGVDALERWLS